jgi:hypothetical protein
VPLKSRLQWCLECAGNKLAGMYVVFTQTKRIL